VLTTSYDALRDEVRSLGTGWGSRPQPLMRACSDIVTKFVEWQYKFGVAALNQLGSLRFQLIQAGAPA
jgi:hypothetical protein